MSEREDYTMRPGASGTEWINTPEEADALPKGSIMAADGGVPAIKVRDSWWSLHGEARRAGALAYPCVVYRRGWLA